MKNNFFLNFKFIIEFLLVYLIYVFLSLLPINIVSFLGGLIFQMIGPCTNKQKIVKKNLLQIFPNATKYDINKQATQSWINTGKTFFELLVLPKIINSQKKIKIEGENYLNNVIKNKEKVIFVGIHQSNWEILLPSIDKLGVPVGGIYRHINNPYINKLILKIRNQTITSTKSFYTPKGKESAKDIIKGFNKDISLVLLVDQRDSAGEIVNFFNFPSKTQTGFIKIARKHKMKIIPIQNFRNRDNNYTLKFHNPLDEFTSDLSDGDIMKKLNYIIEGWIKDDPSNWFLQHNRFS